MLIPRTFSELITYFKDQVSEMNIPMKFRVDLLGMISAVETRHEQDMPKWIPCSERLPEEKDSIFARFYGTPKWNKSMFRKRSQKVLVTVVYPNGERGVDVNHTADGEWYKDPLSKEWDVKTVAWMPFPEPLEGDTNERY